ncbi:MAG: hypothetical protein HY756_10560 [Nitrospirae bacterium]|nr:hypothetical protein [Nitrospirota bacterium]
MFKFDLFSNIPPIGHLYFFYGLAFFLLGLFIVFKETKTSDLKLASHLWLLAWFGFTHGVHEWLDLYLLLQGRYIPAHEMFWVKLITLFTVFLSFLFLLLFGMALISSTGNNRKGWLKSAPVILFSFWVIYLWNTEFSTAAQFFKKADIMVRNTFGFAGGLLTAYGLTAYSHRVKGLSLFVSKRLFYAGITFLLYSVFAGLLPSRSALPYLGIPVEVLRGISAVMIAYFIIKALNIFDIETKRKLEQQLKRLAQYEKLASLGQLAAGVAHEINNPLTNVSLNLQMLKNTLGGINNSEIARRVDSIEKNVDKVSAITKELLQFSRNTESELRPININRVIEGALTLLQYKFKDIIVHKTLSDIPNVMGDAVRLEQVFINILDNSIQAMTDGGDVCIESSYADGWAKIKIADSGMGIPQENLSKVFDPFFSTKDIGAGTGLGLSICYGIITQHNGDINIESMEGEGTIVNISLPIADGKDENGLII